MSSRSDADHAEPFLPEVHKRRLEQGSVLVARESLEDPNFKDTVVLLCHCDADGAYGLVLNRPSHMPLREIFESLPETVSSSGTSRPTYIGGPVQSTELQILHVGSDPAPNSMEIVPDVHLGGTWIEIEEFLSRDPRELRLFLGYAGWGKGQLEQEIDGGSWEVWKGDLLRLLKEPEESWNAGSRDFLRFVASW